MAFEGTDCGYNVDTSTGEMASLFYDTLGNIAFYDTSGNGPQAGWGLPTQGRSRTSRPSPPTGIAQRSLLIVRGGWTSETADKAMQM